MVGLEPDDRAYRRGLVLGWSLAEVFVLMVFALLFAFAALSAKSNGPSGPTPISTPAPVAPNYFSDSFPKLVPLSEEKQRLIRDIVLLEQQIKQLQSEIAELTKNNQQLAAQNKTINDKNEQLNRSQQICAWFRNQQNQNTARGGGFGYPPCWFKTGTVKPEYIFDVTLTSTGIIIHKNELPEHDSDEKELPLSPINFENEIGDSAFVAETFDLFTYSEKHNCRFFVRLFDQTRSNEKAPYQQGLRAVEAHFYKLQTNNPASP